MPLNAAELGQAKVWSIAHAQHIIGLPVEQALLQCVDHTNLGVETFAKVVWPTNQPTPEARTAQKFSADTRGIISTWRESGGHDLPVPHTDLSYDVSRLWFRAGSSIYIMSNFDPHQQTVRSAVARLRVVRLAIPEILRTNPLEPEDNRLARLGEVEQGLAKVAMPRPPQRLAKYPGYSSSVPWHRSR